MKLTIEILHRQILIAIIFAATILILGSGSSLFAQEFIEQSQSLDLELESSTPRSLLFRASKDEFVEFEVAHLLTSLKATVTAPSGKRLISLVSPSLFSGTLPLPLLLSETGTFKLTLEAERPGRTVGTIRIRYLSKRGIVPIEDDRQKAYALISEAQEAVNLLMRPFVDRSRREMIRTNLNNAIELCQKHEDRRCVAVSSMILGNLEYEEFGNVSLAETSYKRAALNYEQVSDPYGAALASSSGGVMSSLLRGKDLQILATFDKALDSSLIRGDQYLQARILTMKGRVLRDWGEGGKGFELEKQAIQLFGDGDLEGRFRATIYANSIAQLLSDRSSRIYSKQLPPLMKRIEGKFHPSFMLWVLKKESEIAAEQKDWRSYDRYTEKVIAIADSLANTRILAIYLLGAGTDYLDLKMNEKALPYLKRAYDIYERSIPREAQAVYVSLGRYHLEAGHLQLARELLLKAVDLNQKNGDRYAELTALYQLVDTEVKLGDFWDAEVHAEQAYKHSLDLRGNYLTAVNLNGFDLTFLRDAAERMITVLYFLYRSTNDEQYLNRSLEIQEMAVSRSLLNTVLNSGFDLTAVVERDELKRISTLQSAINEVQSRQLQFPGKKQELNDEMIRHLVDYDNLLEVIRRRNPNASLLNDLPRISADEIRSFLDEDTALIQFSIKSSGGHAWIIGKGKSKFYSLGSRNQINILSRRFIEAISTVDPKRPSEALITGSRLSNEIISPLLADLRAFRRILVVPDETLSAIPFAALPIPDSGELRYLAEEFEIGVLPSVSTLVALRRSKNRKTPARSENLLAVVADPVFEFSDERMSNVTIPDRNVEDKTASQIIKGSKVQKLARLPFTSVEAREISAIAGNRARVFKGLDSNRDAVVTGQLSEYKIIHFATHGFLNTSNPELSSLALSMFDNNGRSQNGFLRALDIYALRFKADLVVLSACQTAGFAKDRGDYLAGLTRGFMYAGVPTVMASLWKVDDSATTYFMRYFYDALLSKGLTPTAALREAQGRFIKSPRWKSPKYWAAFTVQGEYDVTFK